MKKILWIVGSVIVLTAGGLFIYAAIIMGGHIYMAQMLRERGITPLVLRNAQQEALNAPNNSGAEAQIADMKEGEDHPFLTDDGGYHTEDNWLASSIAREISEMAFVEAHPNQSMADLKVLADVQIPPGAGPVGVTVQISGWDKDPISVQLAPDFAWDAKGYAPLATKLYGTVTGTPADPVTDATDILSHLLKPDGTTLAVEDVRLSGELTQKPLSWQVHEEAALLLTTVALRENAGEWSDNRKLLCRAAAHLAIAEALRGNQPPSWPGFVAHVALETLSGREVAATVFVDALQARPDVPPTVTVWLNALRLIAKQDWRVAQVSATSPVLLKLAWFQVLCNDLSGMEATHRLDAMTLRHPSPIPRRWTTRPRRKIPNGRCRTGVEQC
jgi:hypothetical protein